MCYRVVLLWYSSTRQKDGSRLDFTGLGLWPLACTYAAVSITEGYRVFYDAAPPPSPPPACCSSVRQKILVIKNKEILPPRTFLTLLFLSPQCNKTLQLQLVLPMQLYHHKKSCKKYSTFVFPKLLSCSKNILLYFTTMLTTINFNLIQSQKNNY